VTFIIERCDHSIVERLCAAHHGYKSSGKVFTYAFAVYESGNPVAAFSWKPPPPGAAKSVCPEYPQAVLALSRMVAVPKGERRLKHISKPLMAQMKRLIDRGRWPVLVTYSDEGQGHTGYVYQCSGWTRTMRAERAFYLDEGGGRACIYSNGKTGGRELVRGGMTTLQRWEHWVCPVGNVESWMREHGWARCPVPGKTWRSGEQAFTMKRLGQSLPFDASGL
jgi:hypothetical protein